jgi:hypothetical protein
MRYFKTFIFIFLGIGIIAALVHLFVASLFDDWGGEVKEDKENQILFANAYSSDGWNGATLELLNNNRFRYGEFGGKYQESSFRIENETFILDKEFIGGFKAVLRYDTNSITKDTFLMILDNKNVVQRENRYRVHANTNKTGVRVLMLDKSEPQGCQ